MQKFLFNSDISVEIFLNEFWNKKPLLIKNAIPNAGTLASLEDFIQMAQDEDFETRLVLESEGKYPWQLIHGPIPKKFFKEHKQWALMCHNLNLLAPEFFELEKSVSFLNKWKFDDVMAVCSMPGASVGAHIDNYNVFILQGQGRRLWQLELNPKKDYIKDLDIRLLQEFKPDMEWTLNTGDIIYIPPGVAHHGLAQVESISYSIGFKSFETDKLLDYYTSEFMASFDGHFILDEKAAPVADPFLVSQNEMQKYFTSFKEQIINEETFSKSFSKWATKPHTALTPEEMSPNEIVEVLELGVPFERCVHSRMLATQNGQEFHITLFEDNFCLTGTQYQEFKNIYDNSPFENYNIKQFKALTKEIIVQLIAAGHLLFVDEEDDEI